MKIWNSMEINENIWKSINIYENLLESMKIYKITEIHTPALVMWHPIHPSGSNVSPRSHFGSRICTQERASLKALNNAQIGKGILLLFCSSSCGLHGGRQSRRETPNKIPQVPYICLICPPQICQNKSKSMKSIKKH